MARKGHRRRHHKKSGHVVIDQFYEQRVNDAVNSAFETLQKKKYPHLALPKAEARPIDDDLTSTADYYGGVEESGLEEPEITFSQHLDNLFPSRKAKPKKPKKAKPKKVDTKNVKTVDTNVTRRINLDD